MLDINTEQLILSNLVFNENYIRTTLPFLKDEYFSDHSEKVIFEQIREFFIKYNVAPTPSALLIEIQNLTLSQTVHENCEKIVKGLSNETIDETWLIEKTEKFCQDKAIYNAIMESIQIIDNKSKKDRGSLPQILQDALSVSFDTHIGHDFLEDADARYDFYHEKLEKLEFDLEFMNIITRDGLLKKTLNVILAGTGVGKTLMMCHFAASHLMRGKNVLYITLEMAEERIAERIDANLLNIPLSEIEQCSKETYQNRIQKLQKKTQGKLIIKEYPTASVGSGHFRHLLNELKQKRNFVPDIIYIDYLNLAVSTRMKMGGSINSYTYIKSIAEELRGLAVEFNVPIFTATQTNRTGFTNSDVGLEDTSESFGLPATVDFMIAAISNEELEGLGQIMIKQLKNRYGPLDVHRRFMLGIDRSRMKLYDVEQQAQKNIAPDIDDRPVMDNTSFGSGLKRERFDKNVFDTWK
jgi:replicative DNA helicase